MGNIEALQQAINSAFEDTNVTVVDHPLDEVYPPVVVAMPGDPFLEPSTHGTVRENWRVQVIVNGSDQESALPYLRGLALRAVLAAQKAGALWEGTSTVYQARGDENLSLLLLDCEISFRYDPTGVIEFENDESESE